MRFLRRITIARPRDVVWRAFVNPAVRAVWDARLRGADTLSGTPGQPGAITRLVYGLPAGPLVLVETVVHRLDPEELVVVHAGESLGARLHATFAALPGDRTRWQVAAELHLRGRWRLLAPLVRVLGPVELARTMHRLRRALEALPVAPVSALATPLHREPVQPE
jgi:uncharacterized protein YndB with AHSA1/START domain